MMRGTMWILDNIAMPFFAFVSLLIITGLVALLVGVLYTIHIGTPLPISPEMQQVNELKLIHTELATINKNLAEAVAAISSMTEVIKTRDSTLTLYKEVDVPNVIHVPATSYPTPDKPLK
jgi:hypothetical protein